MPGDVHPTAVLAIQVLHYFPPRRFAKILRDFHDVLEPGGAVVHIDAVRPASTVDLRQPSQLPNPRIESAAEEDPRVSLWSAAALIPDLAAAFQTRSARSGHAGGSAEYHPDQQELEQHLREAVSRRSSSRCDMTVRC